MGAVKSRKTALIAATAIILGTGFALAQESEATSESGDGGVVLTFGLSTSLRLDDNYKLATSGGTGTTTIFDNALSFGISSETRVQTIRLTGGATLRYADVPDGTVSGLDDENLQFLYSREAANARLRLTARYRNYDRDFLDPFLLPDDEVDPDDLIFDSGTLTSYGARATLDTGLQAPLGFSFSAGFDERDYTATTDPDLFDTSRRDLSATARLRLSSVTEGRITAAWDSYIADDTRETDRDTTRLSFGVVHELDAATTVEATIGQSQIKTDEVLFGGPTSRSDTGAFGSIEVTRAMVNGTASVLLDSAYTVNGSRNTLSFSRAMDLPSGQLAATVGVTDGDGGTDLIGSLAYLHTLKNGSLTATLEREVFTRSSDAEVLATRVGLVYAQDLTSVSGLSLSFDWLRDQDGGAGATATIDRTQLRAAYTHSLTQDWDLSAGYMMRTREEAGAGDARSNSVFLTLDRSFTFRR